MIKKSLKLEGHNTSVSLEKEFWDALEKIAFLQKKTVKNIIEEIDKSRINDSSYSSLSSKIRVYIIKILIYF
jgi:predicted DNA-binding ribbon-helix-helix protein